MATFPVRFGSFTCSRGVPDCHEERNVTLFVKTWTLTTCLVCEHVNALEQLAFDYRVSNVSLPSLFAC